MKNTFPEYYPINKEVLDKVWHDGIFCYDANVLLNLYRYSNDTRNKVFDNIKYFIGRTIMPYQACYEYHKNKRDVVTSLLNSYDEIIKIIGKITNSLESGELSGYRKHCALDINRDIIKPFTSTSTKIIKKIEDTKINHTSYLNADAINNKITLLFDGKISDKFSEEELKKIYAEGKIRYDKKIPPGFADKDKKTNCEENSLYGDLIIWKHLIEISKSQKSDILFVTDDRKKDWWDIYQGQTKGVLPELYREFKEQTSHDIIIYSVEDFMKYAPEHSSITISKDVINEIEELRKVDEKRKNYIDADVYLKDLKEQTKLWSTYNQYLQTFEKIKDFGKMPYYSELIEPTFLKNLNKASHLFPNLEYIDIMSKYADILSPSNYKNKIDDDEDEL